MHAHTHTHAQTRTHTCIHVHTHTRQLRACLPKAPWLLSGVATHPARGLHEILCPELPFWLDQQWVCVPDIQ